MITLHIAKLLENNGFGTLNLTGSVTGENVIYWEKLPEGKSGIYILTDGDTLQRGRITSQRFTLYARGSNDVIGNQKLENILDFFKESCYPVCELPIVAGYSTNIYTNTSILPISNIQNIGLDDTNRLIWSCSASVNYNRSD